MKLETISPSVLEFLSGITVSVAINLITSVVTDSNSEPWHIFLIAFPWVIVAALFFWAGSNLEYARREADILISSVLSQGEKIEIYSSALDPIRSRVKICLFVALMFIILGFLLLFSKSNS